MSNIEKDSNKTYYYLLSLLFCYAFLFIFAPSSSNIYHKDDAINIEEYVPNSIPKTSGKENSSRTC